MADSMEMRDQYLKRHSVLKTERSSWVDQWSEITDYVLPTSGRYFTSDRNDGKKRTQNIYDNTASRALKVMAAGMMAGATSPARPWFRLAAADPELSNFQSVRLWLDDVAKRMMRVFQKSNTYRALHQVYEELGAFGTAVSVVLPDFQRVIHHYPVTAGEYCLQHDAQGRICTMYREFDMSVGALVKEFGMDAVSTGVRQMFKTGTMDSYRTVLHVIEPRSDRDQSRQDSRNMPWRSIYFELGSTENGGVLRESGFERFPVLAPRWSVAGGDVYGSSPGMEALGDIKQLQLEQLRKSQGIDFQTKPALVAPTAAKNGAMHLVPGGVSFVDSPGQQPVRPAFEANSLNLNYLLQDIQDIRGRIQASFFADLFLMLANAGTQTRMTATEVAERHEEKLLMLGPVLERLHNELLEPLIDITFDRMMMAGALPPPPQELAGMDLSVEFVSMLAQAQRAIGTNAVDRLVGGMSVVAQLKPDVLDKLNADAWVDAYSDMLGVDPKLIVSDEAVQELRTARAQAQAAKEQNEAMMEASQTAKNLGTTPTGGQNALTDITNMYSGYTSPSPTEVG